MTHAREARVEAARVERVEHVLLRQRVQAAPQLAALVLPVEPARRGVGVLVVEHLVSRKMYLKTDLYDPPYKDDQNINK